MQLLQEGQRPVGSELTAPSLAVDLLVTKVAVMQRAGPKGTYKAAVWKRDLVSMLPKCTPNSSRLDSSKLLNTVPLRAPVCFLFRACVQQHETWYLTCTTSL